MVMSIGEVDKPLVTDHALIRWLERRHGIDMEGFRECLTEKVERFAKAGCKSVKMDGLEFRFVNGRLVTVVASDHVMRTNRYVD
jgi:hypothetical protein